MEDKQFKKLFGKKKKFSQKIKPKVQYKFRNKKKLWNIPENF